MEKRVQHVTVEKHLSFYDARKLVDTIQLAMVASSYAAAVKATTRSVSVDTYLTWRHNKTQLKTFDTDKQVTKLIQKQREVVPKKKQTSTATIYNVSDVLGFK